MNQKALLAKTLLWIAVLAASIGVCLWIVFALDEGSGTMSALVCGFGEYCQFREHSGCA